MSIIDKINDQQEMLMTKRKLKIYHFSNLDKHMEEGPCTKNSDSICFLRKTNTHARLEWLILMIGIVPKIMHLLKTVLL